MLPESDSGSENITGLQHGCLPNMLDTAANRMFHVAML